MTDKLYTFGCTFNVVKHEYADTTSMTDMELAQAVLKYLQWALGETYCGFTFVKESIHPIMGGPEGGVDIEE